MIPLASGVRVWLATGHTDMRKGFASLSLLVQEVLRRDPLCGRLFCFRGRRGDLLKVIWHDGQGACLFTKRLERGRFLWPTVADKGAIKWTRLSCRTFAANAVRLQLHALAYNLGNFLRTLATPEPIKDWSLTSLKHKLIKIGAKVVSHGRYVIFQMAEVAIPRQMFQEILRLIAELRPQPPPALA
jgi:IS66 Orf2 like protein/Transposase DDE domain group 1